MSAGRSARIRRRIAVTIAALATLTGCGDQPGFDAASVENYLVTSQADVYPGGEVQGATCPSPLELEEGMAFQCTLSVSGARIPYSVELTRVHEVAPRISVRARGVVIRAVAAQRYVAAGLPKTSKGAEVDCGSAYLAVEKGDEVTCSVTLGAQHHEVGLTVGDGGSLTVAG